MSNWEKDYEAAQREQERNQELKRHNDLLDRHSIQQRLASEEKNRLLENQVRQTEKQNEILQQQAIAEERRREQELKQKQEQFYKDKIFELKKIWAQAKDNSERDRIQILLSEVEGEYEKYKFEEAEKERKLALQAERYRQEELIKQEEEKKRQRRKKIISLVIGLVILILMLWLFLPKSGRYQRQNDSVSISRKSESSKKDNKGKSDLEKNTDTTVVPSLSGKTVAEAKAIIEKQNLKLGKEQEEYSDSIAEGYIIKTNPVTGSKIKRGNKINLIVSKGPNSFEMPNYVGETRAKAEEDLKNTYKVSSKMITVEEVETFDYAAGTVLEQTPAPGEQYSLSSKTKIVLKVAKETTSIEMPNYVGSTYDFARSNLIEIYGIKESNIKIRKTNHLPDGVSVSAGQIVSQTPEVSSTVDINRTRIVLTVYEPNEGGQNRNRVEPNDNSDDSNSKVNDTGNSSSGSDDD